jgi:8-oxo-dGTP pyrophosphatase MutT (NUDIX family)
MKKNSCGIIVIYNDKVLLCHPTKAKWTSRYGVPKGRLNDGEENIDCAVREFKEETGITIDKKFLTVNIVLSYENYNTKEIYKKLFLYVYKIASLHEIGLESETVPKSQLQLEEIDWCGFMTKEEALPKIFAKQISVLDFL